MSQTSSITLPAEGIADIPTQPSAFKARVVSVAVALLALLGWLVLDTVPAAFERFIYTHGETARLFADNGISAALDICLVLLGYLGFICGVCGLLSLLRMRLFYHVLRAALAVVYPLLAAYLYLTWQGAFAILDAEIELGGNKQDRATILLLWWQAAWPALAMMLYTAWLHVMTNSQSVYSAFSRKSGDPLRGDHILEDIRTHGPDPRHRRSTYTSALTHLLIIIIIPWLMGFWGCIEPYRVPKGSGDPVVAMVKMVKPKKKKKKTLSLRPNSAIIFEIPDLDETEVDKEMEEKTQLTYTAQANAKKMGKGGGKKGGWPAGMDKYKIRFIRIDHGGAGWDDGMNETGADINFLRHFAQTTGFKKIANKGESHSIALLKKYPKDGFPPFIYLTGNHNLGRVSPGDMKILRDYCLNGGMLIADAGSAVFHRSFTHFIRQVFRDKPLLDIADDDMLYQLPYGFPNGAPAFWHHGGRRAMGMKHEGRWMVFYHPGDMNDAWKSQGYTDVTPDMRDAAMNLGVNLIYYAFNQWDDAVTKARK